MSEPPTDTIPFFVLPAFVRAAALCSLDLHALLCEVGVALDALQPDKTSISLAARDRLLELCVERAQEGHAYFPFAFGDGFAFEYAADLEMYLATSPTLRAALRVFEWMPHFIDPRLRSAFEEGPRESRLAVTLEGVERCAKSARYLAEALAGVCCRWGRVVRGGEAPALALHFHFAAPEHADRYEAYYGLPICFDQPETAVILETALLDQPLRGAFPALNAQTARRLDERFEVQATSPLIRQLERAFAERPALLGLSIDAMAKRMGLSRRTLQRRLSEEGVSYSSVQTRVRISLAEAWLRADALSIEEISERLGFSDRRSFTQAFTRGTGTAPSAYRKVHGGR